MHHEVEVEVIERVQAGEVLPAPGQATQRHEIFARFSADFLHPIAVLSNMHLVAVVNDDEGIFPESAPEVCRAARLESKTRSTCRRSHQDLRAKVRESLQPEHSTCPFGLELFCLPVTANGRLRGFIEGGRVFRGHKLTDQTLEPLKRVLRRSRWAARAQGLSESYLATALVKNSDFKHWMRVLSVVASTLAAQVAALDQAEDDVQHPGILKAISYMRQHLAEALTPVLVARAAGVSENYFAKLFKRETGVHFSEFLARERICKACGLLLETGQNVSEIAFAVGFDSVPYFNRCFKSLTKTSPRAYRLTRDLPALTHPDKTGWNSRPPRLQSSSNRGSE